MWLLSNKVFVKESGLLEGFCDYHCHLLPGVDDGVQETEETLEVLSLWEEAGVKEVWLTPHIMEDVPNKTAILAQQYAELMVNYQGTVELHLAAENMMDHLFLERLDKRDLLPIGKVGTHLLVETSYYNPPMGMERIIDCIKENGYVPILAHPERYQYMESEDYQKWKQRGGLLQLNLPSLVGAYGLKVQRKAERLVNKGMYDFCGTDTHTREFAETFMNSRLQKKIALGIKKIIEAQQI